MNNELLTLTRAKNMQRGMDVGWTGGVVFPKSQAREIIETRGMGEWVDGGCRLSRPHSLK